MESDNNAGAGESVGGSDQNQVAGEVKKGWYPGKNLEKLGSALSKPAAPAVQVAPRPKYWKEDQQPTGPPKEDALSAQKEEGKWFPGKYIGKLTKTLEPATSNVEV